MCYPHLLATASLAGEITCFLWLALETNISHYDSADLASEPEKLRTWCEIGTS